MASIASPLTGSSDPTSATDPSSTANALTTDALGDETTFLQLLVTEIQNQDPTQPMDSTTFLTQLAQFSQLEQTAGIRQDIETGTYDAPSGTASTSSSTASSSAATDADQADAAAAAAAANTAAQDVNNTALTSGI